VADIRLNLDDLQVLWADLARVCRDFGDTHGLGSDLIDSVGHRGLTRRLRKFGSSWDERRKEMIEDLDTVWRGVKLVEEAYRELDITLAQDAPGVDWSTPTVGS
jgi:hypothetical protein